MPHTPHRQGIAAHARTRDGRALFFTEQGQSRAGRPTVVFEAGMAASRSWWALVQPPVAELTRTIVYDRAGLGRSPRDPGPRTLARMADDLNDVVDQRGAGPFVLVAHSGGGPIARAAIAARPERIAGPVLVEVPDEACDALFEPSFRRLERVAQRVTAALARLHLLHLFYRKAMTRLPAEARQALHREGFTVAAIRTRGAELAGLVAGMNAYRTQSPVLPDIPVTLISGALCDSGMSPRIRAAANAAHAYRALGRAGPPRDCARLRPPGAADRAAGHRRGDSTNARCGGCPARRVAAAPGPMPGAAGISALQGVGRPR